MMLEARIENGQIVTDEPTNLPEGTKLRIEVVQDAPSQGQSRMSFVERFQHLIGKAENLPADASVQLDHYLYGVPKKDS
ncbi:MAG: hypothetical protein K8T89_24510 [Planctomycetes bacterium]|nr:hypothetical protein [Planctomycetota bacterium]